MSAATTTDIPAALRMFFDNFGELVESPDAVPKLRELILDLAVRGKLGTEQPDNEPAADLLQRIEAEKARLVQSGSKKQIKSPLPISDADSDGLPSHWSVSRLGSCIELISGQHLKPDQYNEEGNGRPYLTGPADFGSLHPTATRWTYEQRAIAIVGDILVTVKGAGIGKTNVLATPTAFISRQLMAVRPILLDRDFVRLVLLRTCDEFQSQGVGIAIPGIGRDDILNLVFWVPPLPEQRRIVAKVDGLMALCDELEASCGLRDQVRERANRSCLARLAESRSRRELKSAWRRLSDHFEVLYDTPETLADLRQSILQLAVQGKLVPQDPNDEPASEMRPKLAESRRNNWEELELSKLVARGHEPADQKWKHRLKPIEELQSTRLHQLPANWEWVPVEEVGAVQLGRQRAPKYANGPNMTPYLRVQNVFEDRIDITDVKEMHFDEADTSTFQLRFNDILLNEGQSTKLVGRPAIYREEVPGACFQNTLVRFRHYDDVLPEYALIVFRHYMRGRFQEICQQTTNIAHLGANRFARLEFPLPPRNEQNRIVVKAARLLSQCDQMSARLRERQVATQELLAATIHHLLNNVTFHGQLGEIE